MTCLSDNVATAITCDGVFTGYPPASALPNTLLPSPVRSRPAQGKSLRPDDVFATFPLRTPGLLGILVMQLTSRGTPKNPDIGVEYNGNPGIIRCIPQTEAKKKLPIYKAMDRIQYYQEERRKLRQGDKSINYVPSDFNGYTFITGVFDVFNWGNYQCYVIGDRCTSKLIAVTDRMSIAEKAAIFPGIIGQVLQGIIRAHIVPENICLNVIGNKYIPSIHIFSLAEQGPKADMRNIPTTKDSRKVARKKLTWAVGAVLYKMISNGDVGANYVPPMIFPGDFYQSPELNSLRSELAMNNAQTHENAKKKLAKDIVEARASLKMLTDLMREMLRADINKRLMPSDFIKQHGSNLGIAQPAQ
ncbi:hypothetical protein SYNPS1DRAFT_27136 [Syncephalis pseudoplumigaleata]|uniref:Protein kinase domain-containing protein n=1 Tax=Syncephalis pseudoplumigaleata TaxID=1712513 RepID=A0A4P9Z457_9FUNG|nr:hypothetical protein SYNPS1DRAFT_27136 [Syncephalis pseudoplumigaleata]|eukprot:RKP27198.1 hypothetical protein SYNPS1DRAFT_27136 [Syncephalis pseudoplumigaleata]